MTTAPSTSRKTRLCVVTPAHWTANSGGAEFQVLCLLEALLPLQRYDIYYVARRVPGDLRPDGYRVVGIEGSSAVRRLGYVADAVPLYRALREIRPDVIYQRIACGYTGITAYYARRHGARLIWHISSDTDVIPERLRGGSNALRRYLEKLCIEYGIVRAHHVIAQSDLQARLLKQNYGRTADAVIPNFHPRPREPIDKTGPVSILWVANLKPLKRPEVFVRLAARLKDLQGVRFTMVGAPPEQAHPTWCDALMRNIHMTPNLKYVGKRTHDEVNELFARGHVLVNTSQYEGFPNTFIQAWMREVPVVSLHIDPDDVLERQRIGIHARTEEMLADAVRMLVAEPGKRAEYGTRARRHAEMRHSLDNVRLLAQSFDTSAINAPIQVSVEDGVSSATSERKEIDRPS
jgi:glycosyltransferase involved in cell wall biosynthesis